MFHAEFYMDRHTYFCKDHIFWLGLRQRGQLCCAWCVFQVFDRACRREFEKVFSDWFYRGLALALARGAMEIQKEIGRFGGFLENTMSKYGIGEAFGLCVCFGGQIYGYQEKEEAEYLLEQNRGLYLGNIAEEALRQSMKRVYEADKALTGEEAANHLRSHMLAMANQGMLENGYFLLWEEQDDL